MQPEGNQNRLAEKGSLFVGLAYAGILPFLAGLFLQSSNRAVFGVDGIFLFCAYSCAILSFLCGVWWAAALNRPHHPHRSLLAIGSNTICMLGWIGLLAYRSAWGVLILGFAFALLVCAESYLNPNRAGLYGYFRMRMRVSLIVVLCHLVMFWLVR